MTSKQDQSETVDRVRQLTGDLLPEIRELRHELHACPEIHPNEHQTRERLAEAIAGVPGLDVWDPLVGTDLVVDLNVGAKRTILLRADIDALPIVEETGKDYASTNEGVMHACGHDGHAAMLVGAVRILSAMREQLPVNVRFVFQPGEEMAACGEKLVELGVCKGADAVFALHGWPQLPEGVVSSRPGPMFAAANFYQMVFHGKGGHAASPPGTVSSPIPVAAEAVLAIEELREKVYAETGAVVAAACMNGGIASNVIPETATIEGTVRFVEDGYGDKIETRLQTIVDAVSTDEVTGELDYRREYWLPVINTDQGFAHVEQVARACLPEDKWQLAALPTMGAEDFAFYLPGREGAIFWLGLGEDQPLLHTPQFDFNDDVLETGILMHCLIALLYG